MSKDLTTVENGIEKQRVFKDNALIAAKYSLTLAEQKVLNALLSQITTKSDKNIFKFKISELAELCQFDKDSAYSQVRKLCIKLRSRVLYIPDDKGYIITGWINSAECKNGIVEFEVDSKLMPYFQALSNFTVLNLLEINMFKHAHTQRIYEWLLHGIFQGGSLTLSVNEIKARLKMENKYTDYRDFRKKVLEPAIKEIGSYTTLRLSYMPVKEGKAITAVAFNLSYSDCSICNGRGLIFTSDYQVVVCRCHPLYPRQQE